MILLNSGTKKHLYMYENKKTSITTIIINNNYKYNCNNFIYTIYSYWLTELTSIKIVKLMNNIHSNITNRKILPTPGSENWKTLLA